MDSLQKASPQKKQENVFISLAFNLLIPVLILQKGPRLLDFDGASTLSLVIALAFPLAYGLNDYFKNKNKNIISIIGFINILITGGFALARVSGHWFAIKEAAVPLVLGLGVLLSIKLKKPFMNFMLFKSGAFNSELLKEKIEENNKQAEFDQQMNKSTYFLSISFFLSSVMNYFLGLRIFKEIDLTKTLEQQKEVLNTQIADMNWMGMLVISIPLVFFLGFILWDFFRKIKTLSGLSLEDLVQN